MRVLKVSEDRLRKLEENMISHRHAIEHNGEKIDKLTDIVSDMAKSVTSLSNSNHELVVGLKHDDGRFALLEQSLGTAHARIDKYDAHMSKLIIGVLSAVGMALLGLVLKVS